MNYIRYILDYKILAEDRKFRKSLNIYHHVRKILINIAYIILFKKLEFIKYKIAYISIRYFWKYTFEIFFPHIQKKKKTEGGNECILLHKNTIINLLSMVLIEFFLECFIFSHNSLNLNLKNNGNQNSLMSVR